MLPFQYHVAEPLWILFRVLSFAASPHIRPDLPFPSPLLLSVRWSGHSGCVCLVVHELRARAKTHVGRAGETWGLWLKSGPMQ